MFVEREMACHGGLVGKGADHEPNDRTGCNRGQDSVAAIIIVDPVVSVWRFIQAPIIIVADDDRIVVVAIVPANPIARDIVAIIDEPKGWARVVVERTVSAIIEGPWRIAPEIMLPIAVAIVVAIAVAAKIPVEIPVVPVMPIAAIVAMVIIAIAAIVPVIVIAIVLTGPDITARIALTLRITSCIRIAPDLAVFVAIFDTAIGATIGSAILTLLETAVLAHVGSAILALFDPAILAHVSATVLTLFYSSISAAFDTTLSTQLVAVARSFSRRDAAFSLSTAFHAGHFAAIITTRDSVFPISVRTSITAPITAGAV